MGRGIIKAIRKKIITGIIVLLPLGLTVWIVSVLFDLIGSRFLPLFKNIPAIAGLPIPAQMAISAALTVFVIWFVGLWAGNYIGKKMLSWLEGIVLKTPIVSKIYETIRKITDNMFVRKQAFKDVAFIEYPRKGIHTLVFVTNRKKIGKKDYVTLFVPSTPNPTTGYCIILPEDEVNIVDITINQAMEFIFSGGVIVPENLKLQDYIKEW
jgi:uncharacterized membrane protein